MTGTRDPAFGGSLQIQQVARDEFLRLERRQSPTWSCPSKNIVSVEMAVLYLAVKLSVFRTRIAARPSVAYTFYGQYLNDVSGSHQAAWAPELDAAQELPDFGVACRELAIYPASKKCVLKFGLGMQYRLRARGDHNSCQSTIQCAIAWDADRVDLSVRKGA